MKYRPHQVYPGPPVNFAPSPAMPSPNIRLATHNTNQRDSRKLNPQPVNVPQMSQGRYNTEESNSYEKLRQTPRTYWESSGSKQGDSRSLLPQSIYYSREGRVQEHGRRDKIDNSTSLQSRAFTPIKQVQRLSQARQAPLTPPPYQIYGNQSVQISYAELLEQNLRLKSVIEKQYNPLREKYRRLKEQQEDREYLLSQLEWKVKQLAKEMNSRRK